MVKGVSKTVIVVNNTGSKLFEKIVFYVTPEYGNLSAKQLKKAAGSFTFNYNYPKSKSSLRKKYRRRKNIFICSAVATVILGAIIGLIILL